MSIHDAQLVTRLGPGQGARRLSRPVVPQPHRHVVAPADEDVARMRAPRQSPNGVLMPVHQAQRTGCGVANVKGANDAVHAARGHDGVVVLVPVVREDFSGRAAGREARVDAGLGACRVDGDRGHEVVLGRGRGAQVEDAEVRVGRDG